MVREPKVAAAVDRPALLLVLVAWSCYHKFCSFTNWGRSRRVGRAQDDASDGHGIAARTGFWRFQPGVWGLT